MIEVLIKIVICGIIVHVIANVIKLVKLVKSLDNTNCACNKGISGKIVLACQDEILNTTLHQFLLEK